MVFKIIMVSTLLTGCTNLALVRVDDRVANERLHAAQCTHGELQERTDTEFTIKMHCFGPEKKLPNLFWDRYTW